MAAIHICNMVCSIQDQVDLVVQRIYPIQSKGRMQYTHYVTLPLLQHSGSVDLVVQMIYPIQELQQT